MCAEAELYRIAEYSHVCTCGNPIGYGQEKCTECIQMDETVLAFDIVIDELNDEIARRIEEKEENES